MSNTLKQVNVELIKNFHIYTMYTQMFDSLTNTDFYQETDEKGNVLLRFINKDVGCNVTLEPIEGIGMLTLKTRTIMFKTNGEQSMLNKPEHVGEMTYHYNLGSFLDFIQTFNCLYRDVFYELDPGKCTFGEAISSLYVRLIDLFDAKSSDVKVSTYYTYLSKEDSPNTFVVKITTPSGYNKTRSIIFELPTQKCGLYKLQMVNHIQNPNGVHDDILFLAVVTEDKLSDQVRLLNRVINMEKAVIGKDKESVQN